MRCTPRDASPGDYAVADGVPINTDLRCSSTAFDSAVVIVGGIRPRGPRCGGRPSAVHSEPSARGEQGVVISRAADR